MLEYTLDYDLLLKYEKYKKLIKEQFGEMEALEFEEFVRILWGTKKTKSGYTRYRT